jgi:hypothetical protein
MQEFQFDEGMCIPEILRSFSRNFARLPETSVPAMKLIDKIDAA